MELVFLDETPRPMAVVPLNVEQYHSMRETGILDEDEPVELIDGLLVYKDRKHFLHGLVYGLKSGEPNAPYGNLGADGTFNQWNQAG